MCATCGCGQIDGEEGVRLIHADGRHRLLFGGPHHDHDHDHDHGDGHHHTHGHGHDHGHVVGEAPGRLLHLERDLLAKNDEIAAGNRRWLDERQVVAFNLLGSPGCGKTALLEHTIRLLAPAPIAVLEGDQDTTRDADRIRAAGASAVQINTGRVCHLDASMVQAGLVALGPALAPLLFVENVGNLVCPALFGLGEHVRVVVLSVTEGEDKPLKYPHAFRSATVLVVTKVDLLSHLDFDLDRCLRHARQVNPKLRVFLVSARTGEGMPAWGAWLRSTVVPAAAVRQPTLEVR